MPLGKISKKQVQTAMKVLSELQRSIETEANPLIVADATNRFYTLVPHDFGIRQPPLLDSLDTIKVRDGKKLNYITFGYAINVVS